MNFLGTFSANHPVLFVLGLTLTCFVFLLMVTGVAIGKLREPYSEVTAAMVRLALAAGLIYLIWRLGWLAGSGITRLGGWRVWLLAGVGVLYFSAAALYAFYGKVAFDLSSFARLPAARGIFIKQLVSVFYEEILFRGVILFVLFRAWGHTIQGMIGSVVLTAVLFALPHFVAIFMGVSRGAVLLLIAEACFIAVWWGSLVLWGGSIWPAVMLHFVVNLVVEVQGLKDSMVTPDTLAYRRILWASIPLGVVGIGLLLGAWG